MQAQYRNKYRTVIWDPIHMNYPVRKFPETGLSSETIGREWRTQPDVERSAKTPLEEMKEYLRDYNVTKELTRSQTTEDFGYKPAEKNRFNKHTSSAENLFINSSNRRLSDRVPQATAHSVSVMKQSYTTPTIPARLTTGKDQYKHPSTLQPDAPEVEPSWHKDLEPLNTTYDGYEKYLDPYLTTSRLHHRPFTADQLAKESASKDIITYYTLANIPWTRTPQKKPEICTLPLSKPKSMYDREKFKEDFREIRAHNKLRWVPGTFRTEVRDNYSPNLVRPQSHILMDHLEADVKNHYSRLTTSLPTQIMDEHATIRNFYGTETSHIGTGKMISSAIDQHKEKNRRLMMKSLAK